ncbi:outer membrane beta-barrel protein [Flavobacterium chungangense]|uniref:Outer membrane protein beta-barrel domain-containing protein n=1 Tax=Flavobacterium chungangense TaxID=554283 RepID=A0A6V6ZDD9_9FLAO|nr:outer membrane beta-barrel protein [Flavobacterium chungangense]CAD0009821.1 hypothetical protein FLACHUCJ7_04461 [Flavobacterium chungangense]
MKNLFLFLSLLAITVSKAQAPLEKQKIQLNTGFGSSGWGTPIYVGLDYGITDNITIGAEVSYQAYKIYDIKSTILGLQANANYHFNKVLNIPNKWDCYAGLSVNYYNWTIKDADTNTSLVDDTPFGVAGQVGGRYFFNQKIAVNFELGGGNATSGGKIGITYKL